MVNVLILQGLLLPQDTHHRAGILDSNTISTMLHLALPRSPLLVVRRPCQAMERLLQDLHLRYSTGTLIRRRLIRDMVHLLRKVRRHPVNASCQ